MQLHDKLKMSGQRTIDIRSPQFATGRFLASVWLLRFAVWSSFRRFDLPLLVPAIELYVGDPSARAAAGLKLVAHSV
jgi:hypothetical protein